MDDNLDSVWKALSDPTRRALLDLLRLGPRTTGDLAGAFPGLTRYAVMKHLGVLESAGLLLVRREGRKRWNHLNAVPLRRVYERWVSQYEDAWAGSLVRLKHASEFGERFKEHDVSVEVKTTEPRIVRIEDEVFVDASVERVWEALTAEMGAWWPHRFKQDAARIVFEPTVGGRFYEDWGDGNGAMFATVTYLDPPHKLGTRGPMGMKLAASTVMWYELEAQGDGTVLKFSLHASGDIPDEIVEGYTNGTRELLHEAFKPYVEGKMGG